MQCVLEVALVDVFDIVRALQRGQVVKVFEGPKFLGIFTLDKEFCYCLFSTALLLQSD
jgi:hypothetical protein